MLKVRIIPTILYKDLGLVKGVQFDSWRNVGSLMQAVKVYNMRDVDELVFFDICASKNNAPPDFDLVDDFADECFMPLTIGGGIWKLNDIKRLLRVGADKVSICSAAIENPKLIKKGVKKFGSQCITIAIDVKKIGNSEYRVCTNSGTKITDKDPVTHSIEVERMGVGEIILTSIDRDGTMNGYDVNLTRMVVDSVSIPVIASGGAGNYKHMLEVLKDGRASSVAAASIFHFTQQTPLNAKIFLKSKGINTRV